MGQGFIQTVCTPSVLGFRDPHHLPILSRLPSGNFHREKGQKQLLSPHSKTREKPASLATVKILGAASNT